MEKEKVIQEAKNWAHRIVHEEGKVQHAVYSVTYPGKIEVYHKVFLDDDTFFEWTKARYNAGATHIGAYHYWGDKPHNLLAQDTFLKSRYGNMSIVFKH